MIAGVAAFLSILVFTTALFLLRIPNLGSGAIQSTQGAVAAIRDPTLDEDQREREVRFAAIRLARIFFSILVRSMVALFLGFLPIWALDAIGATTVGGVLDYLARWDVIIGSAALITLAIVLWRRSKKLP